MAKERILRETQTTEQFVDNAAKMAMNWTHEYPTGTPLSYIRDDIIEMWERSEGVGIFSNLLVKKIQKVISEAVRLWKQTDYAQPVRGTRKDPKAQATIKKYKHEWRNPPDEENND